MKYLEQAGLFGEGLVPVYIPKMVDRYNSCLKDIGLEPTALTHFSIDGMGWSPEIAAEKKDNFYLSHGGANQFAIILSPRQYKKPIYFPFYSFTRNLMREVFDRYLRHIADITRDTALWLDIDQDLSHYLNPMDLLMLDSIVVHVFSINRMMNAAKHQRKLTRRFIDTEEWFDPELRQKIIQSAEKHGDLRFRRILIPDIPFNETTNFYTMAFDGLYVIRDNLKKENFLLILENEEMLKELGEDIKGVSSTSDFRLPSRLVYEGLARFDASYYRQHPDLLNIKRECIFVDILSTHRPELNYEELNLGQKKRFVRELKDVLPKEFFEIEHFAKQIKHGRPSMRLSYNMIKILMYPASDLSPSLKDIIWQLITEINPMDVILLYTYNKSKFFDLYQIWPESKKNWAVNLIKKHYSPRMNA